MESDGLINSLTSRISDKLALIGKEIKLEAVEKDPLVNQTIQSLIALSQFRPQATTRSLKTLLEKNVSSAGEDSSSAENLAIQSFILRLIDQCLSRHWYYIMNPKDNSYRGSKLLDEKAESDIKEKLLNSDKKNSIEAKFAGFGAKADVKDPLALEDPPALEENLASNLMKIIFQYLNASYAGDLTDSFSTLNGSGSINSKTERPPVRGQDKAAFGVRAQIQQTSINILKYLSASNWPVIFQSMRVKVTELTGTTDEGTDLGDLRFLEWCNLNHKRLTMVFQELNVAFLQFKRSSQLAIALILRKSIWNWIEEYPLAFISYHQNNKRLDGGPEVLFDMCSSLADTNRKKAVFWPLQILLLMLCPDILSSISRGEASVAKKASFFENLLKCLKGSRLADVAAVAYVDLCRVCTYISNVNDAALRSMIPDVEKELRDKLFEPTRPFFNAEGVTDQKLMVDCLTAFFLLESESSSSLIATCMSEDSPAAFKLVLVKSCYNIASETNLPWNPTISSMYSILADPMRKLFGDNLVLEREITDKTPMPVDKKARRAFLSKLDEINNQLEILKGVLRVYRRDPMLAIVGHSEDSQLKENSKLLHNITICLHNPDLTIRTCATEALIALHTPSLIEQWGPKKTMMETFWSCSSTIIIDICRQILEHKDKDDGIRYFIESLYNILGRRVLFLKKHTDKMANGIQIPELISSFMALEMSLLYLLCMPDAEICSQATGSFRLLCEEIELTKDLIDPELLRITFIANIDIYKELSKAGELITGRVAQQKSIRKVFRQLKNQTHINLIAWEDIYKRWRSLKSVATRPPDEEAVAAIEIPKVKPRFFSLSRGDVFNATVDTPDDAEEHKKDLELWQNYTGLLCSLGILCVTPDEIVKENNKEREALKKKGISFDFKGKPAKKPIDGGQIVNRFIMEMVELLICESPLAREIVKELAGGEMNPAIYGNLFRHLESIIGRFFGDEGDVTCNDSYTLFVEQAISLLKLILDRIDENADTVFAVDLDMGNLLRSFSRYLSFSDCSATSLRVKIKMCQLTEVLMLKKEKISLRREFQVRNKLLESLVEWTSDSAKPSEMGGLGELGEKLFRDLDLAVMKTVVLLLDGLPLMCQDLKTETERQDGKSKLFHKYFSYFIKLLNRCRILETIEVGSHSIKENSDLMNLLSKSKEQVKDLGPLKDYTILALSNLLSGNIEAGLKYSLSMGYHEDTKTRAAFMQVLSNILKQGAEFATMGRTTDKDRFSKIMAILKEPELDMAVALCDVCPVQDVDSLGAVLLCVFDSLGCTIPILKSMIEREIFKTDSSPELFRRNSMASRLLASFARHYGEEYLKVVLQPILIDMVENPRPYEVDPAKIGAGASQETNLANLKQMCQAFLDAIIHSADKCPSSLQEICAYLSTVVVEKFPEAKDTSVGGLMFLRFFCPVIVAPDINGLVKPITDKDLRRGLLLITKVIQNLANNVFFGAKEAFMISLNDLLTKYIPQVTSYIQEVATPRITEGEPDTRPLPKLEDDDLVRLHFYLVDNIERIGKEIATTTMYTSYPLTVNILPEDVQRRKDEAKSSYSKLTILLAQLGAPENKGKKKADNSQAKTGDAAYKEFMAKNGKINTSVVQEKKIFYEGGVSIAKRPVFYFVARRLIAETMDMNLVMANIFQVLDKHHTKPFEIFLDLTQFGPENEVLPNIVNLFLNTIPSEAQKNTGAIYFYNVNTSFQLYVKLLGRSMSPDMAKVSIFPASLAELSEYILPSDLCLPKLTTTLETETGVSFSPVTYINRYKHQIPSSIKILSETVHITMLKRQEVLDQAAYLNDVYHVAQIDEALISSYKDENCLLIKVEVAPPLLFLSPKVDLICKAIRNAKARYIMSKPNGVSERIVRPNNVPGTLLNMALLNSGSEDPNLRLASYNMLFSLSATFNFDAGNQLLTAKDLCIPGNNTNFVTSISERLAVTEPHLTFEFLSECFVGIKSSTTPLKHLCLEYMAPWLANMIYLSRNSALEAGGMHSRTRELLILMFDLTVKETEMGPSIQSKIWRTIGQVDELIDMVLDTIVQYAVDHGIGSLQAEVLADTTVTLAAVNVRAGKLVSRLRKLIAKTAINPKRVLTEHTTWVEIAILVRFNLMLSFNNRFIAQHYLPELFHTVSVLASSGPPIIRSSIHGLVINVIQSLCTCIPSDHPNLKILNDLLNDFSEPKSKLLFGLTKTSINAFSHTMEATTDTQEPMPLSSLESIIHTLLDVMTYGSASVDQSNIWRARWMSLVTSTAFQFNPAVQPRAFIVLGCLAKGEVDDDLLYQILVALRGALELFDDSDCNLIISIILCLSNIIENLPEDSRFLQPMFWLGIAFIQIGHMPLVSSSVKLLDVVLRRMNDYRMFQNYSPSNVLLMARSPFRLVANKLDQGAGVSFATNFSFAFSGILLKGLKDSSTKAATLDLFSTMMKFSYDSVQNTNSESQILGYLSAQLPIAAKNGNLKELLESVGVEIPKVESNEKYSRIIHKLNISDHTSTMLLIAMMTGILQHAEFEEEYLFLYGFLAEAAFTYPEVFALVHSRIVPKMNQVLNSNQTANIIDAVQSILYTVMSNPKIKNNSGKDIVNSLEPIGFQGLLECAAMPDFSKEDLLRNARLVAGLVENIIV